jgi:hypothetical protein
MVSGKSFVLLAVFLWGASAVSAAQPSWYDTTILPQGDFIFAVGHSLCRKDEQDAKDEALADATKAFIRYCKVSVDTFDRSVEVYSKSGGREGAAADFKSENIIRAKAFVSEAIPEEWYVQKERDGVVASVLLKIPKEEFSRITKERSIKLSLDTLFYYEGERGKMEVLSEGAVLHSADGYAIYVRPSDTCYLYAYQVDGLGRSYRLFPNAAYATAANPVAAASDCWIPNGKTLLVFDDTTGKEYFYLFASPEKIAEFEGAGATTLHREDLENVISLKKMGVAGLRQKRYATEVTPPKRGELDVVQVKKKLQAEGAFVYETWYWHK